MGVAAAAVTAAAVSAALVMGVVAVAAVVAAAVVVVLGPVQRLVRLAVAAHPRLADVGHRGSPNVVDVVEGDDVIAIINTFQMGS